MNMAFRLAVLSLLCLQVCTTVAEDVTFKNVTFRGYNMYTEKFKKSIQSSNSLKDFLPKTVFDKIEFLDQEIPIIYENALADLKDLDELVIENCGVYEIKPGALKNVPFLRRLSLKGNVFSMLLFIDYYKVCRKLLYYISITFPYFSLRSLLFKLIFVSVNHNL